MLAMSMASPAPSVRIMDPENYKRRVRRCLLSAVCCCVCKKVRIAKNVIVHKSICSCPSGTPNRNALTWHMAGAGNVRKTEQRVRQ